MLPLPSVPAPLGPCAGQRNFAAGGPCDGDAQESPSRHPAAAASIAAAHGPRARPFSSTQSASMLSGDSASSASKASATSRSISFSTSRCTGTLTRTSAQRALPAGLGGPPDGPPRWLVLSLSSSAEDED